MASYFSLLGAAAGILMVVVDFLLPGGGKGAFAPSVFATGALYFLPVVGPKLAMIAPPFLWSAYCARLGRIRDQGVRWGLTLFLLALHVVPGVQVGLRDGVFIHNWRSLSQAVQLEYGIIGAALLLVLMPVWSGRTGMDTGIDYSKRAR